MKTPELTVYMATSTVAHGGAHFLAASETPKGYGVFDMKLHMKPEPLMLYRNGEVVGRLYEMPTGPSTLSAPVVSVNGLGQRWYIAGWY